MSDPTQPLPTIRESDADSSGQDDAAGGAPVAAGTPAAAGAGSTDAAADQGAGAAPTQELPVPEPRPLTPPPPTMPESADGMLVLGRPAPAAQPKQSPPPAAPAARCLECGGHYGPDGYCDRCGGRRPDPRHHFELCAPSLPETPTSPQVGQTIAPDEVPPQSRAVGTDSAESTDTTVQFAPPAGNAPPVLDDPLRSTAKPNPLTWVAGVCDRGIRHVTNEDALALYADPPAPGENRAPRRAAIVACDGVSTATRSARASLAAAQAALSVLTTSRSRGLAGVASSQAGAMAGRLDAAVDAAMDAVIDVADGPAQEEDFTETGIPHMSDPACTLVAAVIEDDLAVVGSVGDSRAYWLPDDGREPLLLTRDDSWVEEQVDQGVPREVAERGPGAHTITRWIGPEAPDPTPRKTTLQLREPGWLMLCTDGLWNYAPTPRALASVTRQLARRLAQPTPPLALARLLVEWANAQGGRDNITVALARIDPPTGADPADGAGAAEAESGAGEAVGAAAGEDGSQSAARDGLDDGGTDGTRPSDPREAH
ncbi:serine/threonine protein phosphatase PrpC [Kineosphaera limosa]|uniref:PPM-type phosphatase domain-containing protein n=1 Tax=Kineosphaera limosa NBRC 100340 TaxID=1184609 RepID=K6WS89_9MICO|nr:protein phosphatase 2C domain-containing protein [Kineosphaera limosa]NYE01559.1 serine/threonine protein phosphatase PrpC [Kineosphaera limosa]GAB96716.1 putative protein serine/threonine phosphatase [Kineosphaera limosa NBRC 100340]